MKQFILTPSMSKRLIGKGIAVHPTIQSVLKKGTLVIVAGTTNGYVAEELLTATKQIEGFSRTGFRRGIVIPPNFTNLPKTELQGDVVLIDGSWQQGLTIFDVVDDLKSGDVILKGGNVLDVQCSRAAVYIGHPEGGTICAAIQAVVGRRVQMIVPIGLEKRVADDIDDLADDCNAQTTEGPRMLCIPGEVFTELDAIGVLSGSTARLLAGGGIYGAEGCVWIGAKGDGEQVRAAEALIESVSDEPPCQV